MRMSVGCAVAVAILLALPVAASAQAVDRPFKATFEGAATWDWPGVHPSGCTIVTTVTNAVGQATHLGRTVLYSSHCPAEPLYVVDGRMTLVASNGDKLFGRYDYDPTSTSHAIALAVTGGTGRFAKATGTLVGEFTVIPQLVPGCNPVPDPFPCFDFSVPWPWYQIVTGTIRY